MAKQQFLTLSGLTYFKDKIISIIEDNESVTAEALLDFDERLKNHTHTFDPESTMPDEFNNMTFGEVLEMLYKDIVENSTEISNLGTKVAGCAPKDHLNDNKRHLPIKANADISNNVFFLKVVNDPDDTTHKNGKPEWSTLPVATFADAGIITIGDQSIAGKKTLKDTLTINGTIDNSGNAKMIQFGPIYGAAADLSINLNNNAFTVNGNALTFNQNVDAHGIYFYGNIYQTKFKTENISEPKTISIKPGIVTKITLNYIETGDLLKLTLDSPGSSVSMSNGMPYSGKCYITVAESVPADLTGLITLSDAKTPESIQYGKSSVIEVSITGFYKELKKYYSWRYIYV